MPENKKLKSSENMTQNAEKRNSQQARAAQAAKAKKAAEKRKKATRNLMITIGILVVLILVVILLAVSCGKKKVKPEEIVIPTEITELPEDTTPETKPEVSNDKPVSLYTMDYETMTCNKVSSIQKEWSEYEDLESFGAFATSEESFGFDSETQAHNDIWNSISTDKEYKIGYELSFDVGGEHKIITILKPGDIENNPDLYNGDYPEDGDYSEITGYMGVWVYDDMHQDGGYYIHITQAEVTEETLLTSIKLRPTPQTEEIENLELKGFSYSSDDEFDSAGHYIGKYAATVKIDR